MSAPVGSDETLLGKEKKPKGLRKGSTSVIADVENQWRSLMGENQDDWETIDAFWKAVKSIPDATRLFFDGVRFAPGGGFKDVHNLTNADSPGGYPLNKRAVWAVVAVFFAVYNTYFILSSDLDTADSESNKGRYLISKFLLTPVLNFLHNVHPSFSAKEFEKNGVGVRFIHFAEISILAILYLRLFRNCLLAWAKTRSFSRWMIGKMPSKESARWFAVATIFWRDIQTLGAFSAMRALTVFDSTQLTYEIAQCRSKGDYFLFVLKLVAVFTFGVDSFLVRYRSVASTILGSATITDIHQVLIPLMFARQLASLVDIPTLINERLFVFIFGGEDSVMQQDERAKREVWNAMMVEALWKESNGSRLKFSILMLSWSDADFQKLVLDPTEKYTAMHQWVPK